MTKITFDDNGAVLTKYWNGDVNINPKCVVKWGNIEISIDDNEEIKIEPQEFVFDGKGVKAGIKYNGN